MIRLALMNLCLILILAAPSWAASQAVVSVSEIKASPRFSGQWRLRLSGTDIHDEQSQSKIIDLRSDLKMSYLLSSQLNLDIQPSLRLQSGQVQSVDGADKPESKISLSQAAAHYKPLHNLKLSAGALNQRYMHTELLIDSIAFPAARAEAHLRQGFSTTTLSFESAIPTSTSLSTNTRELEPTPSFNSALLSWNWKNEKDFSISASTGYFSFRHLPSAVAQKSQLLGNEILKISEAQYSFFNGHEGVEAQIGIEFPISTWADITIISEYLENRKGPAQGNKGTLVSGKSHLHLTRSRDLLLGAGYFSIGPEAAVSYFNSANYETNRIGYTIETGLRFKKDGYYVGFKYMDAEVLYSNAFQSREKTLLLKLETSYANL